MTSGVEKAKCTEERCIRQSVRTVERNVKFRSSRTEADLCTAKNVMLNEDHHEDTKFIGNIFALLAHTFLFFLPLTIISGNTHFSMR